MALVPFLLLLFLHLMLPMPTISQTDPNTIALGSSLSPNTPPWLSPSGIFAFGFIAANNDSFTVGVFILDQQETTVVWTANRNDPPVSSDAVLELTQQGQLVLRTTADQDEKVVAPPTGRASSASLLDSGKFVLYDDESRVLWESFDSPTDTILAGQNLGPGMELVSSKSILDRSSGRFLLTNQQDGNLVMYPINSSYITEDSYWASGFTGRKPTLSLNSTGFLYFLGDPDDRGGPNQRILANGSTDGTGNDRSKNTDAKIYRATLDSDGVFRLYSHHFSGNKSTRIVLVWSSLENRCDVKGFCGFNSFCNKVEGDGATCQCFPGFDFIDPGSRSLGCYQNFGKENCREDSESGLMRYNISSALENVSWINYPYAVLPLRKELCRNSCLNDCNCWAISYTPEKCKKYKLPLRYGRTSEKFGTTAFFKVVLGSLDAPNKALPGQVNPQRNAPVAILASSLDSVALLCFLVAVSSVAVYNRRARKYKKLSDSNQGLAEEYFTLQSFSYDELERATNGFSEELGRGGSGTVYRGTLPGGTKPVAVKRLEKVAEEGIREFRAEMTTIGRTHHRNLVQLVGFCTEGSKKLLVYELMSNGSLADLLFGGRGLRPAWRERVRLVLDVARGVLYLHEECGVHIIHCNLKPRNVLLDESWTAKISDFGMARLLAKGPEGAGASYSAPEWKRNEHVSVKADVYSFGVVLLETVCCRRSVEVGEQRSPPPADEIVLSDWVYRCFVAGELERLIGDGDREVDVMTLERLVKVGLWCIQDDPASRPLMKNVILMLEGTMDIPVPPSPHHSLASWCL